jgi:peptidyl-prolyl cis-trans isomerase D
MLQKLSERIQGLVAWIVIILIAVTFTIFGVDYYLTSHQTEKPIATVNGQPISKQAFETNYRRVRQLRNPSQISAASETAIKNKVLSDMITNEVTIQAAKAAGFLVSNEQANAAILSIPQFQQEGRFSPELYQQALSTAMFTPESFQKEVRQGMLLNQQRFAFIGSAFALPGELKRFVKLYMQTRDYEYLIIPSSLFIKDAKVTEQAIKEYYQKHQKEFQIPEKVSINFVRLSLQEIKNKINVSTDEIKRYYSENESNFRTPAQWQVAHILFAIPKGAAKEVQEQVKQKAEETYRALQSNPQQFSEFVRTKSDDKLSAANGGVLPWLVAGQSGFDKALAKLTEVGQISPPLRSSHGYEIFKLIAYKPAALKPLSEVQEAIREQLKAELAQAQFSKDLEQLSDLSYQNPDSLAPVAEALKLPSEKSPLFSRQGGDTKLTKSKQVVKAAFSHDVLQLGNNSNPIQLNNDTVLVLRVNQHIPATQEPLVAVKETIAQKLASQYAAKQAKLWGMELLSTKENVEQQEKIIQAKQLKWHQIEQSSRDSEKENPAINDLAFSLPRVGSHDGRSLPNGDFVLVRLKKINNGQLQLLDNEQQASLLQQIESSYGMMDYELYVYNLLAKAKVEK